MLPIFVLGFVDFLENWSLASRKHFSDFCNLFPREVLGKICEMCNNFTVFSTFVYGALLSRGCIFMIYNDFLLKSIT